MHIQETIKASQDIMKLLHTEYTLLLYGTNADPPYPCECVM